MSKRVKYTMNGNTPVNVDADCQDLASKIFGNTEFKAILTSFKKTSDQQAVNGDQQSDNSLYEDLENDFENQNTSLKLIKLSNFEKQNTQQFASRPFNPQAIEGQMNLSFIDENDFNTNVHVNQKHSSDSNNSSINNPSLQVVTSSNDKHLLDYDVNQAKINLNEHARASTPNPRNEFKLKPRDSKTAKDVIRRQSLLATLKADTKPEDDLIMRHHNTAQIQKPLSLKRPSSMSKADSVNLKKPPINSVSSESEIKKRTIAEVISHMGTTGYTFSFIYFLVKLDKCSGLQKRFAI
jgi:hypothetical protein